MAAIAVNLGIMVDLDSLPVQIVRLIETVAEFLQESLNVAHHELAQRSRSSSVGPMCQEGSLYRDNRAVPILRINLHVHVSEACIGIVFRPFVKPRGEIEWKSHLFDNTLKVRRESSARSVSDSIEQRFFLRLLAAPRNIHRLNFLQDSLDRFVVEQSIKGVRKSSLPR